jgi:hypothetical protein
MVPSIKIIPHYEAGNGIRPPNSRGRYRAVAWETVPGGGMELWHCGHDHAPGVRDVRRASDAQREAAIACARAYLDGRIADGSLYPLPVIREGEWDQ